MKEKIRFPVCEECGKRHYKQAGKKCEFVGEKECNHVFVEGIEYSPDGKEYQKYVECINCGLREKVTK